MELEILTAFLKNQTNYVHVFSTFYIFKDGSNGFKIFTLLFNKNPSMKEIIFDVMCHVKNCMNMNFLTRFK